MSVWRQLRRGVRVLAKRGAADRELADELQHYLEESTARHLARGLSPDDAARAARLEIGGATQVREQVRDAGWEQLIVTTVADLRYAARGLLSAPGFTAIAVLTLALGIGGTTAIFSAVNPILFEPLPYPSARRLVTIAEMRRDGVRNPGSFGMYRGLAGRARTFDAIAVFKPWQPAVTGLDQPERLDGQRVSATYFAVLGVRPALGRDFTVADDRMNAPNVVILSDRLWRRRFAANPSVIGQEIILDHDPYIVVGVMPAGFENVLAPDAAVWATLQYDMSQGRAWGHHLRTIGRLRNGVGVEEATRELNQVGRAVLAEQRPETYGDDVLFVASALQDDVTRAVKPALMAILAGVTLVLVIACVNVTNLILARGVRRRDEFALRTALGAGRGRIVRQLLTESLLLAAMGGAAGMAVAVAGVRALVALSPSGLPRATAIGVDATAFIFGGGVTAIVGLGFGLLPALRTARSDPNSDLHGRRVSSGRWRTPAALVVAEVALALVLLVSSGLLLRSLTRLFAVGVGFEASGVVTMQVQTSGHQFDDDLAIYRFFDAALQSARSVPGVVGAGFTSQLPLSGDLDEYGAHFEATATRAADTYNIFRYAVSPGYLEAMRIPLRHGRLLEDHDTAGAPRVAVISESLAAQRFAGADPLGQRLRIGPTDGPLFTIVGVVGDVKQVSLALGEANAVYIPASSPVAAIRTGQWRFADRTMSLVVRSRGDAATLAPAVRQAIWAVDKDQPVVRVATMDALVAASAAERRFALVLFEAFALTALILAAAGIYGVLAGAVAERTREIGIRSALGATRSDIVALVARQGMTLTALGVAIGLGGAAAASRALTALLFGISHLDPVTYAAVIAVLGGVSAIACGVPAWRAVRVDPATTLRSE